MHVVVGAQLPEPLLAQVRDAAGPGAVVELAQGVEALLPRIAQATVYFAGAFTPALLAAGTRLRWVQGSGAGVESLLFPEFVGRDDVLLTNARGAHRVSMPEYTLMAMLSWAHHLPALVRAQDRREWTRPMPDEVYGKTLGLLGYGEIGRAVAQRATALGVRCLAYRRNPSAAEGRDLVDATYGADRLHEFLGACDFVLNSLPLTDETRGLIGEPELRAMRPSAVLIHLGRGPTVQSEPLLVALREKWIAGAFLDVFDREPLPPDSPFWGLDNAVITSHSSGWSVHYLERSVAIFCDNLRRFRAGEPLLNLVDKRAGY
jgi:phosphoglycerate dehydrogenase-like enzyme